jgi:broad specificity phosphatase PhoE
MKVILVRHGSKLKDFSNNSSKEHHSPLSDVGRKEATQTGKYLADKKIEKIYTSPLPRTLETANLITCYLNISILNSDGRLKEQLVSNKDCPRIEFDSIIKMREQDHSLRLPNCESISQVISRFDHFMSEIATFHFDTVLVVSHASIMQLWLKYIFDIDTQLAPCSITNLDWENNKWQCQSTNYTTHLQL